MTQQKYLVVIPTYNEKENILAIIKKILAQDKRLSVLVVDDNSPDKTADSVKTSAKFNERVFLIKRKKKLGLGTAYLAGFKWGLEKDYTFFVSMDADFSHPPTSLPRLLRLSQKYKNDIILGSRYVPGGKIIGWSKLRYLNSYSANFMTRLLLGLKTHDATSGYKCYPASFLRKIDFTKINASGYAFQVEMVMLAENMKTKIREFPIVFHDRRAGQSKISGELWRSAKIVFKLFMQKKSTGQFIKFCVVGALCALIDWLVFYLAKTIFGHSSQVFNHNDQIFKQIAKALSFIVSASASYYLNRIWTFVSTDKAIVRQASKFLVISAIGLFLNNLFFFIFTGLLHFQDLIGFILAIITVGLWNFLGNNYWVFAKEK